MKEIEVRDNKHGIEKIVLSEEGGFIKTGSVELIVNIPGDPKGEKFAENILFHQDMAISENSYDPDSFNVKLPVANHIKMTGNITDIVNLLKNIKVADADTIQVLENHIQSLAFQIQPLISDFFPMGSESNRESSIEDEISRLYNSFSSEDRPNLLMFSELFSKLELEKRMALQESLSAQIKSNRGSNTPTRS